MELQVHQKRDWVEVPTRQSAIGKYTEVFKVVVLRLCTECGRTTQHLIF